MRYAFNQAAISYVNRVYNATNGIPKDMGVEFDYMGKGVSALAAAIWFQVDVGMDWAADTDGMFENPYADAIYSYIVELPHWDGPEPGTLAHPAWGAWDEMADAYMALENPLYLACVVAHALMVIDGDPANIWEKMPEIDAEFKTERDEWDAMFMKTMAALDDPVINDVLARDAEELKIERKKLKNKL